MSSVESKAEGGSRGPASRESLSVPAAQLADRLSAVLSAEMPDLLRKHAVPGAQIAIGFRGRVVLAASFGMADLSRSTPMTDGTIFKAASLAKPVTALCVLRLVDRGLLSLDAPFEHYTHWRLPPHRCHGHDPRLITLRRLLSHTSGLDAAKFPQVPPGATSPSALEILDGAFGPDLTPHIRTPPGSTLRYAGSNFELLRVILETVCREPLPAIAAREVFGPLGLTHTRLGSSRGDPSVIAEREAVAHEESDHAVPELCYPAIGSSGLYTNASELARIWLAIGGAPLDDGQCLLSPSLHREMLTAQATLPTGYAFGLGVALARWGDRPLFKHAGIARGLFSMAEGTPDGCVVIMTNSGDNAKPVVMPLVNRCTGHIIAALVHPIAAAPAVPR